MSDSKAWNLSKKTDSERIEELAREIEVIKGELHKERLSKKVIVECLNDVVNELNDHLETDTHMDPLGWINYRLREIPL